ncbi:unnamed protein product [Polarella glacialis]|uniref:D-isomer specific 2-hydroxyacid dehydrogenase NAD-binding domain-containing protein n=1 Tax=Polarella glacialis TaxID=89957 RepID=A0A813FDT5_POLGL|nr:unnamed protein product [Polarella glacialis]
MRSFHRIQGFAERLAASVRPPRGGGTNPGAQLRAVVKASTWRRPRTGGAGLVAVAGLGAAIHLGSSHRGAGSCCCDEPLAAAVGKRYARSPVRAFYLRPDADELQLLEAMAGKHGVGQSAGFELAWGDVLPPGSDIDVLIVRIPSAKDLDSLSPSLQQVIVPFAGPTGKTLQLLRDRPHLSLHNCHFNAASTSELAITLLLAATKKLLEKDADLRQTAASDPPQQWVAGWEDSSLNSVTLNGRRALVLGLGSIGSRVARVLGALGMEVHGVRRRVPTGDQATAGTGSDLRIHGLDELDSLLSVSEVVVVALPGTAATDGLLGDRQLRAMPRGSILVNVGRGSVIDEDALFEVLKEGHLGAAGLDVWFNYPMMPGQGLGSEEMRLGPSKLPFHELGNVVMTPHCGQCSTTKARDRIAELEAMLRELCQTGILPNKFDIHTGY